MKEMTYTDPTVDFYDTPTQAQQREYGSFFAGMEMTPGMFSGLACGFDTLLVEHKPLPLPAAGTTEICGGVVLTATGKYNAEGRPQWVDADGEEWDTL